MLSATTVGREQMTHRDIARAALLDVFRDGQRHFEWMDAEVALSDALDGLDIFPDDPEYETFELICQALSARHFISPLDFDTLVAPWRAVVGRLPGDSVPGLAHLGNRLTKVGPAATFDQSNIRPHHMRHSWRMGSTGPKPRGH